MSPIVYRQWGEDPMAKRRMKRLFPRKMSSDFINTYKGVDTAQANAFDIFKNHQRTKSLGSFTTEIVDGKSVYKFVDVPNTIGYVNESLNNLVLTPRQQAVRKSREERDGPLLDLHDVSFGGRMMKVSSWNKFKVKENLWLYFCRDQWVFVKNSSTQGEVIYSVVYKSKAEALLENKRGRIFWAGEYTISSFTPQ